MRKPHWESPFHLAGKILREEIRLRGFSVREHYRKLVGNHVPIPTRYAPMRHNVFRREIQNFAQTVIISKRRFILRNFAELTVQSLDNIRRIILAIQPQTTKKK